jgi:5-methylcytosine-specific restriction endonuclease McrA
MKTKHKPCLVLNLDYSPISIIDWKTAISWSFKIQGQKQPMIDIVQFYQNERVQGCSKLYQIPSIIKINKFIKHQNHNVKFSRKNLFLRDNYTCQYCGKQYHINKLTYDHVIPKSKWKQPNSPTSWGNIVTACHICNRQKADRTPNQANMSLLLEPRQPKFNFKYLPWYQILSNIEYIPEWTIFMPKELQYESKYI